MTRHLYHMILNDKVFYLSIMSIFQNWLDYGLSTLISILTIVYLLYKVRNEKNKKS